MVGVEEEEGEAEGEAVDPNVSQMIFEKSSMTYMKSFRIILSYL